MELRALSLQTCTVSAQRSMGMAFIIDKEVLKTGLIIFRRGDVEHRNFYCRIKLPKEDRYKTISLHTSDRESARDRAFDQDADIRFRVKHDVAVFNRPFRQVAADYLQTQQRRADTGEVSHDRVKNLRNAFKKALEDYVGSTQIHLIGQDSWAGYPTWRRENGKGRFREHISDATIQFEMGALNAVMNFAITKRLVPASHRFEGRPKLKTMRRDEFTIEEYRKLHSVGRKWISRIATEATQHGVGFHSSAAKTVRRFEILRGLVMLAAVEPDDETVRCLLERTIGDTAHFASLTLGHLCGSLTADDAKAFALDCHAYMGGHFIARCDTNGRVRLLAA